MEEYQKEKFRKIIAEQLGIKIREQDFPRFEKTVSNRMKALKISSFESYYTLLAKIGEDSKNEWRWLSDTITTSETFFFRDKGQFSLLENTILPELIELRKKEKKLRIWSAGCSTGEEAYSLAILIDKILPQRADWRISIIGTDISEAVIKKARKAVYGQWSFRLFDKSLLERYFSKVADGWQLNDEIKDMVTFQYGNLRKDNFPNTASSIYDMDLILCRNVFIYFSKDVIAIILEKIGKTLQKGGYFMTGHSELYGQKLKNLKAKFFAESVVYQPGKPTKPSADKLVQLERRFKKIEQNFTKYKPAEKPVFKPNVNHRVKKDEPTKQKAGLAGFQEKNILEKLKALLKAGNYKKLIKDAKNIIHTGQKSHELLFIVAQAYANLGNHTEAAKYCHEALALEPYFAKPYLLLSQIAQEDGEIEEAKIFLNKMIYLEPNCVVGYLEMASILELEGNESRAKKMRTNALQILKKLPSNQKIEPYDNLTAQDIKETLEEMI